jgi:phospholipid transport system substrate-binding protein
MKGSRVTASGAAGGWRHAALAWCVVVFLLSSGAAQALDAPAARQHVEATINDIIQLAADGPEASEAAARLLQIVERRASVEQVARFAAGRYWRGMSEDEQAAFTRAFTRYLAATYAENFRRIEGRVDDLRQQVRVRGTEDAGPKGVLVRTEILPPGNAPISVDWLVSDRSGRVEVADLIVEGISMAITQREVVGAMLDARGGDVAIFVSDLERQLEERGTPRR